MVCQTVASMGPRRYRRGNGEVGAEVPSAQRGASMGPRRYRRGNGKPLEACIRKDFATPFRAGRILNRPLEFGVGWKR